MCFSFSFTVSDIIKVRFHWTFAEEKGPSFKEEKHVTKTGWENKTLLCPAGQNGVMLFRASTATKKGAW